MLLSRTDRDSAHMHVHWVAGLKKYCRHHASHLCRLVLNALEMAEEKYGVDIQPPLPHYDTIVYLSQYDKASVPVGLSVPLSDIVNQFDKGIVGQDQRVVAADHDCRAEKKLPSVTNRMNITETAGEYLYSGGPNGLGRIFVSVHNSTTDPSTGLKNIANAYKVLINLSREPRSTPDEQFVQPLPYHVHFETDGGTDHRATIFQTRLHILVFFIGNMDTLVETRSCPGILYLNTCKR